MSSARPRKHVPVTPEDCKSAFLGYGEFKSVRQIATVINDPREPEERVTEGAVKARMDIMKTEGTAQLKDEKGESLYALVEPAPSPLSDPSPKPEPAPSLSRKTPEPGLGDLGSSEKLNKTANNDLNDSSEAPLPKKTQKRLPVAELEQQLLERFSDHVKSLTGELGQKLDLAVGGIAGKLQATQESFQKTVDALWGTEREKMATDQDKIQELEKHLQERDAKIAELAKDVKTHKDRADGFSLKATNLERDIAALRQTVGGIKAGKTAWFFAAIAVILFFLVVVQLAGWNSQGIPKFFAPPSAENEDQEPAEGSSGEDEELDAYIRKLESE